MAAFACVVLAVVVTVVAGGSRFTCEMMRGDHLEQTRVGFQINTGSNIYQPGGQVQVKLGYFIPDRRDPFTFIIQAFKSGSTTETVGSWIPSENELVMQCDVTNMNSPDTLYIDEGVLSYTATWQAPQGDKAGDAVDIEFFVIFIDADGNQHKLLSIGMSPAMEPSTLPPTEKPEILPPAVDEVEDADELDLHEERTEDQMKMDAERKFVEEIDEENKATEDGWNKEELLEMRMREEEEHEEEMEYERLLKEEEEERLARIRAEILDKEEHDRLIGEEQVQPEEGSIQRDILLPDSFEVIEKSISGSGHVVAGFISCLLVTVIQMLI